VQLASASAAAKYVVAALLRGGDSYARDARCEEFLCFLGEREEKTAWKRWASSG
jgi:hypothetical protein